MVASTAGMMAEKLVSQKADSLADLTVDLMVVLMED